MTAMSRYKVLIAVILLVGVLGLLHACDDSKDEADTSGEDAGTDGEDSGQEQQTTGTFTLRGATE